MAGDSEIPMSNWLSGVIKVGVLAILLADVSHSAHAGYADCRNSNYYTTAIQLMRALYPELQDKDVTVQVGALQPFEADGPPAVFNIWISEVRPTEPVKTSPNLSSAERVGHLSVHFEFDPRDNRIDHIFSSGSFLNGEKQEALAKLVDEHPDWDEAKMTDALLAAGAKFGPNQKQSLLAQLPTKRLEPLIGRIEVQSVQFQFRQNNEPPRYASLEWTIHFRATTVGESDEYFMSLEPFGGKVVMFGRALEVPHK